MTERRDFHRLPTGAWASWEPAPVDRPWKSFRALFQRRSSIGASEAEAEIRPELLQCQGTVGPHGAGHGGPNTEILTLPGMQLKFLLDGYDMRQMRPHPHLVRFSLQ